jgi:hypothetical protein
MRDVTRFRSLRFRSFVMPLLLAALALRVLIPTDVMPVHGMNGGMSLESSMCSTGPDRNEVIEIPVEDPAPHCERCLLTPPFEAPYAFLSPVFGPAVQVPLLPEQVSQVPESPLARAQAARAPPHA